MMGTQWCRSVPGEAGSRLWGWCEWLGAVAVVMPYGFPAYRFFSSIISLNFSAGFGIFKNINLIFFPLTSQFFRDFSGGEMYTT